MNFNRPSRHDANIGTVGSLKPNMSGRGVSRPMYQYDYEEDLDLYDEEIDDYVDDLVGDDVDIDLHKKIGSEYLGGTDSYRSRGSSSYYVGGNYLYEFSGNHRNVARKGISPFKQPKHSGPPLGTGGSNQAFRTTGNFIGIGTQYGSSRPHKLMTDIEDNNIFSLSDLDDPMERSFKRRNNKVKKILNLLKEYLNE